MKSFLFYIAVMAMSVSSCDKANQTQFGIFKVLDDATTIEMDGVIKSKTLKNFNDLIDRYPNINLINIVNCDGSADDEINLQVAQLVYDMGINTHLNDNGLIASGGVDFFLAGVKRTRGTNTMIGVHSWSDGSSEANEFPVGHANHLPYINFYVAIGFSQQAAEDFYYFTINAAPASDIHYMTEAEIDQYNILNP